VYILEIDHAGAEAIAFVGFRYAWAEGLQVLGYDTEWTHNVPENDAWALADAFREDMEGGHSPFPMLAPNSTLYENLSRLWDSIV
jgi:hypothetical protein